MPYKKNGQGGNRPPRQNQNATPGGQSESRNKGPREAGGQPRGNRPDNRPDNRPRSGDNRPNRPDNRSGNRPDNRPRFGDDRPNQQGNRSRFGDDRPNQQDNRSGNRPDNRPRFGGNRSDTPQTGNPSRRIPEDRGYTPRTGQGGGQSGYQGKPFEKTGGRTNRTEGGRFEKSRGYQERTNTENNRGRYQNKPAPVVPKPLEAPPAPVAPEELPYFLMGRNAVREAVKSGRSIDRILVTPDIDGSLREILGLAKDRGLLIRETQKAKLDELCMPFGHNGKPGNHQGILAMVPPVEYATLEDMLALAKERGEPPFILLLEELTDPYNLGSILRSALCAGAHGVVITKRRAASITAAVAKASAGAVEYIKVAKVNNVSAALQQLKKAGLWIAGGDMGGKPMDQVDLKGPLAIVMGNEGEGLSRLVTENCDHLVKVPIQGPVESLNVSVAAAVLLFEKVRQESIK